MKLPDLNIHVCNKCNGAMPDAAFQRCGVSLHKSQIIFEYECPTCGHFGRYVYDTQVHLEPVEALRTLALLIESVNAPADATKGNIRSQLNKIVGVKDLLRLGGNDAPRETRDDGQAKP